MYILNLFLFCTFLVVSESNHLQSLHLKYNQTVQKVIDAACFRSPVKQNQVRTQENILPPSPVKITTRTETKIVKTVVPPISTPLIVPPQDAVTQPQQQPKILPAIPSPQSVQIQSPPIQTPSPPPPVPASPEPTPQPLPPLFISNPQAPNWILGNMTLKQYQSQLQKLRSKFTFHKCPLDKPFSTGNTCILCSDNQIFNLKANQCEQCPPNTYYNQKLKACTTQPPLLYNSNPESSPQNFVGKPPDYDPSVQNCPPNVPFTNYTGCIQCNLPKYYNYTSLKCEECPPDHSFDVNSKECVSDIVAPIEKAPTKRIVKYITNYNTIPIAVPPIIVSVVKKKTIKINKPRTKQQSINVASVQYLTSPDAPNVLYTTQNPKQYKVQYQSLKNRYQTCPPSQPYFNGQQCVSCPKEYPLFDIESKQCVTCPTGRYFDEKLHRCSQKVTLQPSIQRFLMNIK